MKYEKERKEEKKKEFPHVDKIITQQFPQVLLSEYLKSFCS